MAGFLSILGALLLYVNVANAILIEGSSGSNEQTSDQNLSRVVNNYGSTIDMVNKNIVDQHLYGDGYGAAINNQGTINYIKGNFERNYISAGYDAGEVFGGAIYNNGTIGDIIGDFDGNYAINNSYSYGSKGGAIYNSVLSSIGVIKGSFKNNYVSAQGPGYYEVGGGAIYNDGGMVSRGEEGYLVQYSEILGIEGVFENNYAVDPNGNASGGAIYNSGGYYDVRYNTVPASIGYIKGDFIGNYISALSSAQGGAIYNGYQSAKIGDIDADFEGNYVEATVAAGGAILNENTASIGNITGNFVGNNAKGKEGQQYETENGMVYAKTGAQGGAINNAGYMADIIGGFIGNYVSSPNGSAVGGGISNYFNSWYYGEWGEIGNISGEFVGNYATANEGNALGGAIYNEGELGSINANFTDNLVSSVNGEAKGGAILNIINVTYDGFVTIGSIVDISGDFVGNYAVANGGNTSGGAIYNSSTIGDITGNFSNNNVVATGGEAKGGAIYNAVDRLIDGFDTTAKLSNITGDFSGNYISSSNSNVLGGAIYNASVIGDIKGDFTNNYAVTGGGVTKGGAVYNVGTIKKLEGDFSNNYVSASNGNNAYGGAIYNEGEIGNISGDFSKNKAENGSAIYNDGTIDSIEGDFKGNEDGRVIVNNNTIGSIKGTFSDNEYTAIVNTNVIDSIDGVFTNYSNYNGAIRNGGTINTINGEFTNNGIDAISNSGSINSITGVFSSNSYEIYCEDPGTSCGIAPGGAISNTGEIGEIEGDFIANTVNVYGIDYNVLVPDTSGAGVYNSGGTIQEIRGNFINNFAANGGAIYNEQGTIDNIKASFVGNSAIIGGAISNMGQIKKIESDFTGNYATRIGGAVYNNGSELTFVNSNFRDNYIISETSVGEGAAIYSESRINVIADGEDSIFSGNYVEDINGKRNEAIHTSAMNVTAVNGGNVVFDDSVVVVDGSYDLNVMGDTTGEVVINSELSAYDSQLIADEGAIMHMGKEAEVWVEGFSSSDADLVVDIAVDKENQSIQNGVIHVSGDVVGDTGVIVNSENPDGYVGAKTVYVEALNDDMETESNFRVDRVVGSPYMWASIRNLNGETEGSTWYLTLLDYEEGNDDGDVPPDDDDNNNNNNDDNDDGAGDNNDGDGTGDNNDGDDDDGDESLVVTKPIYTPEVPAFISVPRVAIEQNRSIADSVGKGLAFEKNKNCSDNKCALNEAEVNKNVWVDVVYEKATIDAPHEIDAKIKGVTVGADVYRDANNRAGVFGAVRDGKYELSGEGDYYSNIGSEIETESYLGGVYYKHTNSNNWSAMAIAFIGKQEMDIATDDRIVNASADALQFGVSTEVAKRFFISEHLDLEPSLGIFYTGIDIDNMSDNVGKTAKYDMLHYIEAELGLKLEYKFCNNGCTNRWYVKPSVIQTLVSGGETRITGIREKIDTYDNELLGRFELGGEFGITSRLSGYTSFGYTFGDNYEAYDAKAGLNYEF